MSRLTAFILSYAFLITIIFLVSMLTQNISDSYETDPDVSRFPLEGSWYYWAEFTFTILNIFATIVLLVGLHEENISLIFWWLIFNAIFSGFTLVVAIYRSFGDADPSELIYHYTWSAVCIGLLGYIYHEYIDMKEEEE